MANGFRVATDMVEEMASRWRRDWRTTALRGPTQPPVQFLPQNHLADSDSAATGLSPPTSVVAAVLTLATACKSISTTTSPPLAGRGRSRTLRPLIGWRGKGWDLGAVSPLDGRLDGLSCGLHRNVSLYMSAVIGLCESQLCCPDTPMSPRRMDISSLLHHPDDPHPPRPRTIDALLHHPHPPASLLSILNSPHDSRTTQHHHPHHSPPADHPHPRPPFLGLDALVHVASEERRRISASSLPDRDSERDLATHLDRDRFPERDLSHSFVHDHDRPSRHYTYPLSSYPPSLHRHPDSPPLFQDNLRPHKRSRDAGPPSPPRSPSLVPGPLPSPSTRHHPSASPTTNYPTLRRHPMDPTRSAPALLLGPVNDARTIPHPPSVSLQHTSPFLHSLHSSQLPIHSSPRNNSPHRYSPQHLRSQHHSFPLQTGVLIPPSVEADAMSPRYGYGPRMAGGIEVLSNDPPSIRDPPRPDLANFQSPGRDVSTPRLLSESRVEHARHDSPGRATFLDDDRHQLKALPHQVEGQECGLLRERVRSRPHHSPLVDTTTDNDNSMGITTKEADLPAQPPPERHPIRVWEEQPTPRRVSPVHMPIIVYGLAEGHTWSGASESGNGERPAKDDRETDLPQDVAEDGVLSPPVHLSFALAQRHFLSPYASIIRS